MTSAHRSGATLIELLVTLTILGIIAAVTTLGIRMIDRPDPADPRTIIADTLAGVARSGVAATIQFVISGQPAFATISPDGSVTADSALHIDRFTGRPTSVH